MLVTKKHSTLPYPLIYPNITNRGVNDHGTFKLENSELF